MHSQDINQFDKDHAFLTREPDHTFCYVLASKSEYYKTLFLSETSIDGSWGMLGRVDY